MRKHTDASDGRTVCSRPPPGQAAAFTSMVLACAGAGWRAEYEMLVKAALSKSRGRSGGKMKTAPYGHKRPSLSSPSHRTSCLCLPVRRWPRAQSQIIRALPAQASAKSTTPLATIHSQGRFIALGRRIDLALFNAPTFLLAARDVEIVAPYASRYRRFYEYMP